MFHMPLLYRASMTLRISFRALDTTVPPVSREWKKFSSSTSSATV